MKKYHFKFNQQTANRFMRIAERFGKLSINAQFNSTQMIQLLALPEGEEEKFKIFSRKKAAPKGDFEISRL